MEMNSHQLAIEQLLLEGHTILQIVMPDNTCLYFSVYKFQQGYFNTAESVDYNTVEGINITDFLYKNSFNFSNRTNFLTAFNKVINDGTLVECKFNKDSNWYKWSSSARSVKNGI